MNSNKHCSVSRYVMQRALISHYIIMWLMRNDTEFVRIQWRIFDFGGTFVQCRYLLGIKYLLPQYTGRCTQYWGPAVREQANVYIQYQQKRFVFVYLCICVFVYLYILTLPSTLANVYVQYQQKGDPLKSEHSATSRQITKYSRASKTKISNTDQISRLRKIVPRHLLLKSKLWPDLRINPDPLWVIHCLRWMLVLLDCHNISSWWNWSHTSKCHICLPV